MTHKTTQETDSAIKEAAEAAFVQAKQLLKGINSIDSDEEMTTRVLGAFDAVNRVELGFNNNHPALQGRILCLPTRLIVANALRAETESSDVPALDPKGFALEALVRACLALSAFTLQGREIDGVKVSHEGSLALACTYTTESNQDGTDFADELLDEFDRIRADSAQAKPIITDFLAGKDIKVFWGRGQMPQAMKPIGTARRNGVEGGIVLFAGRYVFVKDREELPIDQRSVMHQAAKASGMDDETIKAYLNTLEGAQVFQQFSTPGPEFCFWYGYIEGLRQVLHKCELMTAPSPEKAKKDQLKDLELLGFSLAVGGFDPMHANQKLQASLAGSLLGKGKKKTMTDKALEARKKNAKKGGRPMNQARVNELFELLIKACQQQFGFVPGRISTNMQFMGSFAGGQYRFRDTLSHATILLKTNPLKARLIEPEVGYTYWTDLMLAEYRRTDEEVESELLEEKNKLSLALRSAFWLSHRDRIYAAFAAKSKEISPIRIATEIVEAAKKANSADYVDFAQGQKTDDTVRLANVLCDCCREEKREAFWAAVKTSPLLQQVIVAKKAYIDIMENNDEEEEYEYRKRYEEKANELYKSLPADIASGYDSFFFAKHLFMDPELV